MKKNKRILLGIFVVFLAIFFIDGKKIFTRLLTSLEYENYNSSINFSFDYLDMSGSKENISLAGYYIFLEGENGDRIIIEPVANENINISEMYNGNYEELHSLQPQKYNVYIGKIIEGHENFSRNQNFINLKNDFIRIYNGYNIDGDHTVKVPDYIDVGEGEEINLNISAKQISGAEFNIDDLLNSLNFYLDYGIFTKYYSGLTHTESNIATEVLVKIGSQFGLSNRNQNGNNNLEYNNKIIVNKIYTKNNEAVSNELVKIKLYKDENVVIEKQCTTDNKGKCSIIFDNLSDGTYSISENINGNDITSSTNITDIDGNNLEITFSSNSESFTIINNKSYIDSIYSDYTDYDSNIHNKSKYLKNLIDNNPENYDELLSEISSSNINNLDMNHRNGILYVGSEELKNILLQGDNPKLRAAGIDVVVPDDKIDFNDKFSILNNISIGLSSAAKSDDIKVYYMNADEFEIENPRLNFITHGEEYVLVNVDCTGRDTVTLLGDQYLNGKSLVNGFGTGDDFEYNESAKIIYNFYQNIDHVGKVPYNGEIVAHGYGATTGIILAPSAVVRGAGNHSGNIIAQEYIHESGEVHQKIRGITKNIDITNRKNITNTEVEKKDEEDNYINGSIIELIDNEKSEVVEEWITSDKPYTITTSLFLGKRYTIHELVAPLGYILADDIVFEYDGNNKKIELINKELNVNVIKLGNNGNYLEGSVLQLIDINGNILDTWTSTSEPYDISKKVSVGSTYIIHELNSSLGYKNANDISFKVNNVDTEQSIVMINNKVDIKVYKYEENDKLVSGAKLQIYDKNNNLIEEWITDESAHTVTSNLNVGEEYILHEESAPKGYKLASDISFTVSNDIGTQEVIMYDESIIQKINVSKVDTTNNYVSDAKMQLRDKNNNILEEWITDNSSHLITTNLNINEEYIIHEEEVPNGYIKGEDKSFKVTDEEQNIKYINRLINVNIKVYKNNENDELLPGALLQLKTTDGTILESWTTERNAYIITTNLIPGNKYILHEEKAPIGYQKSDDIEFIVNEDYNQEIKMYDISRNTGLKDISETNTLDNIFKYILMIIFSGTVFILTFFKFLKYNN